MGERLIPAVLKTVVPERVPGVLISTEYAVRLIGKPKRHVSLMLA